MRWHWRVDLAPGVSQMEGNLGGFGLATSAASFALRARRRGASAHRSGAASGYARTPVRMLFSMTEHLMVRLRGWHLSFSASIRGA